MGDYTHEAGKYVLHGSMVVRDEVPPGVDPLLIQTTTYQKGDVVELNAEQASRLMHHRAVHPHKEEADNEGDDQSAAKVPSLSGKSEGE